MNLSNKRQFRYGAREKGTNKRMRGSIEADTKKQGGTNDGVNTPSGSQSVEPEKRQNVLLSLITRSESWSLIY